MRVIAERVQAFLDVRELLFLYICRFGLARKHPPYLSLVVKFQGLFPVLPYRFHNEPHRRVAALQTEFG